MVLASRSWPQIVSAITTGRTISTLCVTAVIVALNWLLYIHAVGISHVTETSLGQYINPLVNVLLGRLFLGEKLSRAVIAAMLLAATGVLILIIAYGQVPWLGLGLAFSFATYGLLRKIVAIEALGGLFIETAMLFPFALAGLLFFGHAFTLADGRADLLLALAGPVTFVPLLWFTCAARRLPYGVLGFFQYLAPSIQFVLARFVFNEPFGWAHYVTFTLVWIALAIFTLAPRLNRKPVVT
ncbi:MAG TPA: EamA family transporter RarD [Dongiaceae bacterium]|jgi:chloramphenicol-sensitive protein RarD|nr:EamA family transporter RarD [Dongiaceae bacterium]